MASFQSGCLVGSDWRVMAVSKDRAGRLGLRSNERLLQQALEMEGGRRGRNATIRWRRDARLVAVAAASRVSSRSSYFRPPAEVASLCLTFRGELVQPFVERVERVRMVEST